MRKKGVKTIKLNASLYAVPFYEKMVKRFKTF